MKRRIFQIICVLMLVILSTVAVSAEADEQEISVGENAEWSTAYVISDENVIGVNGNFITFTTGDNEEYKVSYGGKVEYSSGGYTIIGGDGEVQTYVFSIIGGDGENGELRTYVFADGVLNGEVIALQTELPKSEMVTVNCSSMIAPAVSVTLLSGTLVAAWILKKRKNDE